MILNPGKCYFLTLGFQDAQPSFSYDMMTLQSKMYQKEKYWALPLIIS